MRSERAKDIFTCVVVTLVGTIWMLLSLILMPEASVQFNGQFSRWILAYDHFERMLALWPWNLAATFLLLLIVIWLNFKKKAWGFALALGGFLGSFIAKAISHYAS